MKGANPGFKRDLLVLAGGATTRLGSLARDLPKALLPVCNVPFLAYPLDQVARSTALGRVIICAKQGSGTHFNAIRSIITHPFHIIEETEPLGTGGAILAAFHKLTLSDPFLVMNGDVLFRMDADAVCEAATQNGAALAAIHVTDAGRFGALDIKNGQVRAFREKETPSGFGLINAGLYAFTHDAVRAIPNAPCSFERDIAPALAKNGRLAAVVAHGPFIDIGTPESYAAAGHFVAEATRL